MYKHLKFLDGYKYLLPRFSTVVAPFVYFSCQKYVNAPNIPSSTSSHISGMTAFKQLKKKLEYSDNGENKSQFNQSLNNLNTEMSFNLDNSMSVHGYLNQPGNNQLSNSLNQYTIQNNGIQHKNTSPRGSITRREAEQILEEDIAPRSPSHGMQSIQKIVSGGNTPNRTQTNIQFSPNKKVYSDQKTLYKSTNVSKLKNKNVKEDFQ